MPANRSATFSAGFGTTRTFAHEVLAGDDRVLFVAVRTFGDRVSVTYDGVALTYLGEVEHWFGLTSVFYLVAPAVGTADVVATRPSGADTITAGAVSYTGVDQTTPASGFATDTAAGATRTLTITLAATGDDVLLSFLGAGGGLPGDVTVGSGQTLLGSEGDSDTHIAGLQALTDPTFNWTTDSNLGMVAFVVQDSGAGSPLGTPSNTIEFSGLA